MGIRIPRREKRGKCVILVRLSFLRHNRPLQIIHNAEQLLHGIPYAVVIHCGFLFRRALAEIIKLRQTPLVFIQIVRRLLFQRGSKNNDLQVLIGSENTVQSMQDCSVITATYKMGDNTRGTIGIVGPTRMDYSQVISVLNGMVA